VLGLGVGVLLTRVGFAADCTTLFESDRKRAKHTFELLKYVTRSTSASAVSTLEPKSKRRLAASR
jgi:hypothetical protein